MTSIYDVGGAALLKMAVEGRLSVLIDTRVPLKLSSVYFAKGEIESLCNAIRAEWGWLTYDEAAQRMGVKRGLVIRWVKAKVLVPVVSPAGKHYLDAHSVEQFSAAHIFDDEAARMLGVDKQIVRQLVLNEQIRCVAGPGINGRGRFLLPREDVERLRARGWRILPHLAIRKST